MKITILAVGKIKDDWLKEGIAEYTKRISKYCEIEIIQVADAGEGDLIEKAISDENDRLLSKIKENDYVIALDLHGEMLDSVSFSKKLIQWIELGGARIKFVIAGSNGYGEQVIQRANQKICLSKLTFTHQMTRLILLEQIFRSFKILKGEKYHK